MTLIGPYRTTLTMKTSNLGKLPKEALKAYNETRHPEAKSRFCHAPWVSLNFKQTGEIRACCLDRQLYGHYPQQNLDEIWTGLSRQKLCQEIQSDIGPSRCSACVENLERGEYENLLARNFDELRLSTQENQWPLVLEFELSNNCNLMCRMCSGEFSSRIRSEIENNPPIHSPYNEEFVEQLKPYLQKAQALRFLGGEPFMNPLYYLIWDYLIKQNLNPIISITSNGTIYNEKIQKLIERLDANIVLSIDSLNSKVYEYIRRGSSFDNIASKMKLFRKSLNARNKPLWLTVCLLTWNWKDLPETIAECEKNGDWIYLNTVYDPSEASLLRLSIDEREKIAEYWINCIPNRDKPLSPNWKKLASAANSLCNSCY